MRQEDLPFNKTVESPASVRSNGLSTPPKDSSPPSRQAPTPGMASSPPTVAAVSPTSSSPSQPAAVTPGAGLKAAPSKPVAAHEDTPLAQLNLNAKKVAEVMMKGDVPRNDTANAALPNVTSPVDDQTGETQEIADSLPPSHSQSPTPKRAVQRPSKPSLQGVPSAGFRVHNMDQHVTPASGRAPSTAGPTASSRDQEDDTDEEDSDQKALADSITLGPTSSATTSSSPIGQSEDALNAASPSPGRRGMPTMPTVSSTSSAPGTPSTSLPTQSPSSKCKEFPSFFFHIWKFKKNSRGRRRRQAVNIST